MPFVPISDGRKVQILIYDAVGFKESEQKDKALLKYIKDHVPKVHLLLVCHKLYDKVCDSTIKLVKLLAEHFTKDILNHTLFLLTHAALFVTTKIYRRSKGRETQAIKEFEARFQDMKRLLNQAATEKLTVILIYSFVSLVMIPPFPCLIKISGNSKCKCSYCTHVMKKQR